MNRLEDYPERKEKENNNKQRFKRDMGFVDRGGGREAKGASLRRSKKNPGAAAARVKTETKGKAEPTVKQRAVCPTNGDNAVLPTFPENLMRTATDSYSVQRTSRTLWLVSPGAVRSNEKKHCSPHVEKARAHVMCNGVYPDNVDRTNKKAHQGWQNRQNNWRWAVSAWPYWVD